MSLNEEIEWWTKVMHTHHNEIGFVALGMASGLKLAKADYGAVSMKAFKPNLVATLRGIHSALDDALGDSDIEYMDDEELRAAHPIQWAAAKLAEVISELERQK